MKITTIEQLEQRIGKFVLLSKCDPNCNDFSTLMKKITKIEKFEPQIHDKTLGKFYHCKIWGTCTANKTPPFDPTSSNVHSATYSRYVQYARDPTPQELKIFLNMWRISEYKKGNIFPK